MVIDRQWEAEVRGRKVEGERGRKEEGERKERGCKGRGRGERKEGNRKRERKGDRNQRVREGGASGIASHDILPHAYDSVLIIPLSSFGGVVAYALCEVRVCQQPYDSVGQSLW